MTYDIPAFVNGVFAVMTCKQLLVRKANLLQEVQVAKLAMIEAIVNAVFSAVHTGTVPPEVLARAESLILASEGGGPGGA